MVFDIAHIQISVPKDFSEAVVSFYCDLLGFTKVRKIAGADGNIVRLQLKDFQLMIIIEIGTAAPLRSANLAYFVEDLEAWRDKIQRSGIDVSEKSDAPQEKSIGFLDPVGNRVEFIERFSWGPVRSLRTKKVNRLN